MNVLFGELRVELGITVFASNKNGVWLQFVVVRRRNAKWIEMESRRFICIRRQLARNDCILKLTADNLTHDIKVFNRTVFRSGSLEGVFIFCLTDNLRAYTGTQLEHSIDLL